MIPNLYQKNQYRTFKQVLASSQSREKQDVQDRKRQDMQDNNQFLHQEYPDHHAACDPVYPDFKDSPN